MFLGATGIDGNFDVNNKFSVDASTGNTSIKGNLLVSNSFGTQQLLIDVSNDLTSLDTDLDIIGDVDVTGTNFYKGRFNW